jgi:hypothetical protein
MSIRTFIFCDICNPQATRTIESRRSTRQGERTGRRMSDGRAWLEVSQEVAVEKHGWRHTAEGLHVCFACQKVSQ